MATVDVEKYSSVEKGSEALYCLMVLTPLA